MSMTRRTFVESLTVAMGAIGCVAASAKAQRYGDIKPIAPIPQVPLTTRFCSVKIGKRPSIEIRAYVKGQPLVFDQP